MIKAPNSYEEPINSCPQTIHTYINESKTRSSVFWHVTLLRLVVIDVSGQPVPPICLTDKTDGLSRNVVRTA